MTRLQFGLRTMMVIVALSAIVVCWAIAHKQTVDRNEALKWARANAVKVELGDQRSWLSRMLGASDDLVSRFIFADQERATAQTVAALQRLFPEAKIVMWNPKTGGLYRKDFAQSAAE